MKILISLVFIIGLTSCVGDKEEPALKSFKRPSELIQSNKDFTTNDIDHVKEFLDKHYESLKKQDLTYLKTKDQYIEEFFHNESTAKQIRNDMIKFSKTFDKEFPNVFRGKLFNFYYNDLSKEKNFFYIQEPFSPLTYYMEVHLKFYKELSNHNYIIIDNMNVLYQQKSMTAEEVNDALIADLEAFYKEKNLHKTQKIFHPICFAYALSYKLFEERTDLYDKVIYYTPYPSVGKDAELVRIDKLYEGKKRPPFVHYADIGYLYYIGRGQPFRSWVLPKVWSQVNFATYYDLAMVSIKGRTLKNVKNKALVHSENEVVLSESSFEKEYFDPDEIKVLKGRGHNDFMWVGMGDYFRAVKSLLK